jgi:2-dehydropantoate 2-reductase
MKIGVFGVGAVGGHLAARLASAGEQVSCVARGPNLAAIRSGGITLRRGDQIVIARVAASDRPSDLGPQDVVFVTVKATAPGDLAGAIAPMLHAETAVVFAQNGIPWWYPIGLRGDRPAAPDLRWLDPGGRIDRIIGARRTIGAVVISSNQVVEPGVVVNDTPDSNALIVGEIDDHGSPRVVRLRQTLEGAGLASPPVDDIRKALWSKLVNNMTVSVLCMLTGQTARAAVEDPVLSMIVRTARAEAFAIAEAHGAAVFVDRQARGGAPDHKPSFLQDYELGRSMEIDALVRAPLAFARHAGVPAPMLECLGGLAIRRAIDAGLYRAAS